MARRPKRSDAEIAAARKAAIKEQEKRAAAVMAKKKENQKYLDAAKERKAIREDAAGRPKSRIPIKASIIRKQKLDQGKEARALKAKELQAIEDEKAKDVEAREIDKRKKIDEKRKADEKKALKTTVEGNPAKK